MENTNFIQSKDLFSLNTLACLRNEYYFNDCTKCFEQCNEHALGLYKDKITLFTDKCTSCAHCIGVCPTQALNIDSFDVNQFVLSFVESQKNIIVEKIDIPTFMMFDTYHLISLVLRTKQTIFLEFDGSIEEKNRLYIETLCLKSNQFLQMIGIESSLILKVHQSTLENTQRRSLLKNILNHNDELQQQQNLSKKINELEKNVPAKVILLKNSLKLVIEDIQNLKILQMIEHTFFNYKIDYIACTKCNDCITFCPTQALFENSTKDAILFQMGKCIGCSICHSVCKEKALHSEPNIDLIQFAFNQAQELVHFEYEPCKECKTPFIYKGGEKTCSRCSDFQDNFSSMFKMANEF